MIINITFHSAVYFLYFHHGFHVKPSGLLQANLQELMLLHVEDPIKLLPAFTAREGPLPRVQSLVVGKVAEGAVALAASGLRADVFLQGPR